MIVLLKGHSRPPPFALRSVRELTSYGHLLVGQNEKLKYMRYIPGRSTYQQIHSSSRSQSRMEGAKGTQNNASQETFTKEGGDSEQVPCSSDGFQIIEKVGAIFEAPDNTIIIHACNCMGSWSAGIADAFKQRYPRAYEVYKEHCENNTPASLIGTSLLIPPVESKGPRHFIGCLFTSKKYGRGKDSPVQILGNTGPAMKDLVSSIARLPKGEGMIEEIRMCKINSGLFSVPWASSKAVIENLELLDEGCAKVPGEIIVYSLPAPPKRR